MFIMPKEWLLKYYGSKENQIQQTKEWLLQYGHNVTVRQIEEWKNYKHSLQKIHEMGKQDRQNLDRYPSFRRLRLGFNR